MNKQTSKISLNRSISNLIVLVPCLLIGSCQSSVQTYYSCEQNKGDQTLATTRITPTDQIRQNNLSNVSFKNPAGISFEATKGQTLFYTAEDLASSNKKSGGSFCVLVRETSTNKALDSYSLNHLPSSGSYTIEVYSLDQNETINQNISIKASLNSDNFRMPAEVELKALYQFKSTISKLRSLKNSEKTSKELLDNMIVLAAINARDSNPSEGESKDKKEYYKKLVNSKKERDLKLKKVLQINDLNIFSDEIVASKAKEIIEAIYIFQVQFLDGDKSSSINGMLNQDTKEMLVIRILNQDKVKTLDKSDLSNKNLDEYKKPISQKIQRYFANIVMQRCDENWKMLGASTIKAYGDNTTEYFKYCREDKDINFNEKLEIVEVKFAPKTSDPSKVFVFTDFIRKKKGGKYCETTTFEIDKKPEVKPEDIKLDIASIGITPCKEKL